MLLKYKLLFLLGISCFSYSLQAQNLVVATYNIRFDNPRVTGNLWVNRAPAVANLIRFHDFDLFGTQEGRLNQLDDLSKLLPQYQRYGLGRDDGKTGGEFTAIFFKKDEFRLLNQGDFWLSETPDKPSMGWDGKCCNRICSWVYLQEIKSKKKFYFFNVHFDHEGIKARTESAKLMLKKISEIARKEPVILTGDFNGNHTSAWYQTLANSGILIDSYQQVANSYLTSGTFQDFGRKLETTDVIDHIFVSKQFAAEKWGVLTDSYHGKFPSDHFPVEAVLWWNRTKK